MAIPKYQDLYPLILKFSLKEQTADEYLDLVAKQLKLSEDEIAQRYPSGEGMAFPQFSRHLIMSKLNWRESHEEFEIVCDGPFITYGERIF